MSASTSTSTSALPTLRQAHCQLPSSVCAAGPQPGNFLGPSELSVRRWTSTGDLPSSVTFPAQCAPLDLNLGPSELSVRRWTSTGDLPSSVCTAGPQPGTFPAQCAPVHRWTSTWDLPSSVCTAGPQRPDRMPEEMPDRMSDKMPEDTPDKMP